MNTILSKRVALMSFVALMLLSMTKATADVIINLGPEPACPYGYYDYEPYYCAPYGYYGPDWFIGGRFIGAGPWFHGPHEFRGHVDNHFDPKHGYRGAFPERGDVPFNHFRGNEVRNGRG